VRIENKGFNREWGGENFALTLAKEQQGSTATVLKNVKKRKKKEQCGCPYVKRGVAAVSLFGSH